MTRRQQTNERGYFTIWVLGLCVCLLFIGGLSFDMWNGFSQRRQLDAIADGASIAGASQIDLAAFKQRPSLLKLDETAARQRALAYIEKAKNDEGITLTAVNVVIQNGQVRVALARNMDISLTKILSPGVTYEVSATGTAAPKEAT